jgi:hypothetical protein
VEAKARLEEQRYQDGRWWKVAQREWGEQVDDRDQRSEIRDQGKRRRLNHETLTPSQQTTSS